MFINFEIQLPLPKPSSLINIVNTHKVPDSTQTKYKKTFWTNESIYIWEFRWHDLTAGLIYGIWYSTMIKIYQMVINFS